MRRRTFLTHSGAAALSLIHAGGSSAAAGADSPALAPTGESANLGYLEAIEMTLAVGERRFGAKILSPRKEQLAPKPLLLLILTGDLQTALKTPPFNIGVPLFLARGHRAVSFDLPDHGRRVASFGEGISAWRQAWLTGQDRFQQAVEEATALIDHCVKEGWATPERIMVYGVSRGGYLALRLLAADARIAAAAAIAPVTDWRELSEFTAEKGRTELAATRLSAFADKLAGRRIYMAIGDSDRRVSTLSCCRFFIDLQEANASTGVSRFPVEFHCTRMAEPGHSVDNSWRQRGGEFLLEAAG